ncbi:MAG: alpha/beta hydrolase, partial [Cyanobacteriota bacterium]
MLASLLVLLPGTGLPAARAADELVVQFDGLQLPIDLAELEAWTRQPHRSQGDQAAWLNLLDAQSRQGLSRLLRAPLLRDRSFGMELLNSWTGESLLGEVGALLQGDDGESTAPLVLATLQQLFQRQQEVSSLDLLRALPQQRLVLRIDGLLALAADLRDQLRYQSEAMAVLRQQPLPLRRSQSLQVTRRLQPSMPRHQLLPVAHRPSPLPLELWPAQAPQTRRPWLVLMPGLGGSSSQLSWLAGALAQRG